MGLTLSQCISKIKDAYPEMYPKYYIIYKGKYIFSIFPRGVNNSKAIMDLHMVDPDDGGVSASIPLDILMHDKEVTKLLQNPHEVDPNEQKIEHSVKIRSPLLNDQSRGHYYGITRTQEHLSHHGIPGQKWGERNGPPYPLDNKTHNKVVSDSDKVKMDNPKGMDPLTAYYAAEAISLLAFCIATPIYVKIKKNKNHKKWKDQNNDISEDYLSDIADIKKFSDSEQPKKINGDHSREDDMAAINPTYGQSVKGNTSNCVLCSAVYDIRRRGYDVTAKLCETGMYTDKVVKDMYEGAKEEEIGGRNWSAVAKRFEKKYPEGSRGIISVNCIFGGHAMAFEIKDGKLEIYDGQAGKQRKLTDEELSIFDPQRTQAIRLDDKKVIWANADVACAELKSDWKKTIDKKKAESKKNTEEANKEAEKVAAGVQIVANLRQIREYKKEHPGTKLTDSEILKNIYGKQ